MNIVIAGDTCDYNNNKNIIINEEVVNIINNADYSIINLESPVFDGILEKIEKTGPNLKSSPSFLGILKDYGINIVSLANNHILDYGSKGLINTIDLCNTMGIKYVGAGKDIDDASKPLILTNNNLKVAIINACENEWSIASENSAGANPIDIIDICRNIKQCKQYCDFVILILHGGNELYDLPSPRIRKNYRFFAEQGANAIIGHHSHCISGYEYYNEVPIIYSVGNFLFTYKNVPVKWNIGIMACLNLEKGKHIQLSLIPIHLILEHKLSLCKGELKEQVIHNLNKFSNIIKKDAEFFYSWDKYINSQIRRLRLLSPLNAIRPKAFRSLLFHIFGDDAFLSKDDCRLILNNLRCESHYEVLTGILNSKVKS